MGRKRIIRVPENQRALPFRRDTSGVLAYANRTERRLLMTIAACFMVASALYVYAVVPSYGLLTLRTNAKTAQLGGCSRAGPCIFRNRKLRSPMRVLEVVPRNSRSFIERSNTLTLNRRSRMCQFIGTINRNACSIHHTRQADCRRGNFDCYRAFGAALLI